MSRWVPLGSLWFALGPSSVQNPTFYPPHRRHDNGPPRPRPTRMPCSGRPSRARLRVPTRLRALPQRFLAPSPPSAASYAYGALVDLVNLYKNQGSLTKEAWHAFALQSGAAWLAARRASAAGVRVTPRAPLRPRWCGSSSASLTPRHTLASPGSSVWAPARFPLLRFPLGHLRQPRWLQPRVHAC